MSLRVVGLVAGALLTLAACSDADSDAQPRQPAPSDVSPTTSEVSPSGSPGDGRSGVPSLADPRITESSGLARSPLHPGVLYTHNDRGNSADLFAVDATGTRAVLRIDVKAVDWEDIASTPDGRLWIADTGNNDLLRSLVEVVVVEEPQPLHSARLPATSYPLRYPDGRHDAEALLVDPRDDRVYVVTKDPDGGAVYAAPSPLVEDRPNLLTLVGPAPLNVTAGDFAPDGTSFALRNQGRAFFYTDFGSKPIQVTLPRQTQGESLAYTADGSHVFIGSEGTGSEILLVRVPKGATP